MRRFVMASAATPRNAPIPTPIAMPGPPPTRTPTVAPSPEPTEMNMASRFELLCASVTRHLALTRPLPSSAQLSERNLARGERPGALFGSPTTRLHRTQGTPEPPSNPGRFTTVARGRVRTGRACVRTGWACGSPCALSQFTGRREHQGHGRALQASRLDTQPSGGTSWVRPAIRSRARRKKRSER